MQNASVDVKMIQIFYKSDYKRMNVFFALSDAFRDLADTG